MRKSVEESLGKATERSRLVEEILSQWWNTQVCMGERGIDLLVYIAIMKAEEYFRKGGL